MNKHHHKVLQNTMANSSVDVVIVTFNSAHVVKDLILSLPTGCNIIVVDNSSSDETVGILKDLPVRCVKNAHNVGFGKASNLGASLGQGEYILFVNPDAVLQPDALEVLMNTASSFPEAAAVGPRLVHPSGKLAWRFSSAIHPISGDQIKPPVEPEGACCVPVLTGAALLCRRDAFDSIGGFDENIFLYYEDDDICRRLLRHNWSLIYEPQAKVFHASDGSTIPSKEMSRFKSMQKLISLAYVSRKYGYPFNLTKELCRSYIRLLISIITFHGNRRAAALGRIDAIKRLKMRGDEKPSIARGGDEIVIQSVSGRRSSEPDELDIRTRARIW